MFLLSSVGRAGGSDYKGKNIDKKVSDFGSETVYSSLAQSVERLTVNQDVTGSSPVGGAI